MENGKFSIYKVTFKKKIFGIFSSTKIYFLRTVDVESLWETMMRETRKRKEQMIDIKKIC